MVFVTAIMVMALTSPAFAGNAKNLNVQGDPTFIGTIPATPLEFLDEGGNNYTDVYGISGNNVSFTVDENALRLDENAPNLTIDGILYGYVDEEGAIRYFFNEETMSIIYDEYVPSKTYSFANGMVMDSQTVYTVLIEYSPNDGVSGSGYNYVSFKATGENSSLQESGTALASGWKQDTVGWWWQNEDGTYPVNCWQLLDGNKDGVSEWYYFGADGYMLADTTTPDGYQVNADGAWIENGVVQLTYADEPAGHDVEEGQAEEERLSPPAILYKGGTWDLDDGGWRYIKADGTYLKNGWALSYGYYYYLDSDGYMLRDTTTPDGYQVTWSGAWAVDGVTQKYQEG